MIKLFIVFLFFSFLSLLHTPTYLPQQTKAEDPFCVYIFILKHFKLVSKQEDPTLCFLLCLSPATVTSIADHHSTYLWHSDLGCLFQCIPRATSQHVILRHMHPTCPSLITGAPTQHLGFGHRPLPTLFHSSDRCFGVVCTVGLYTSIPWSMFVSSSFVLRVYY